MSHKLAAGYTLELYPFGRERKAHLTRPPNIGIANCPDLTKNGPRQTVRDGDRIPSYYVFWCRFAAG